MGGVGVIPPLTREEILAARMPQLWPANPDPAEHNRRSIYLQMKRSMTLPHAANLRCAGYRHQLPAARKIHRRARRRWR